MTKNECNPFIKSFIIGLYRQGNSWETMSVLSGLNVIDIKIIISRYTKINIHNL